MKKKLPIIVILIASALTVFGTLIQNRIQRACVDYGDLYTDSQTLNKHSFAVNKLENETEDQAVYREIYASTGGLGVISLVNFALLTGTLLWVNAGNTPKT